jgi:hypothetical protein
MGTIKTTNIETITGSGTLTLGQSGETISVPSGATLDLSSATQTGVGGTNTPAFHAYNNSAVSVATNTATKITNLNEVFDTDSAFASDRFTVPSGQAGKYFIYGGVSFGSDVIYPHCIFYVNGAQSFNSEDNALSMGSTVRASVSHKILNLSASDYVELYTFQGSGATNTQSSGRTFFGGYKIIGA